MGACEYGDGVETQSLYVLTPGGQVEVRQRTVDAETTRATPKATKKEVVRAGVLAFLVLVGVFLISSIFIDYKKLLNVTPQVRLMKKEKIDKDSARGIQFIGAGSGKNQTRRSDVEHQPGQCGCHMIVFRRHTHRRIEPTVACFGDKVGTEVIEKR